MTSAFATRSTYRSSSAVCGGYADSRERQGAEVIPFMTTRMIADSWAASDERSARRRQQRAAEQEKASKAFKKDKDSKKAKASRTNKSTSRGVFASHSSKSSRKEQRYAQERAAAKEARAARATQSSQATQSSKVSCKSKRFFRLPLFRLPKISLPQFRLPGLSHLHMGKGLVAVLLAPVLCLGLTLAILYPVAKDYFAVHYSVAQLEAEYDAVSQRNDTIEKQIQWLQTDEGVEYRAREAYGWVKEGETVLNVTGADSTSTSTVLPTAIPTGSVQAESSWLDNLVKKVFSL